MSKIAFLNRFYNGEFNYLCINFYKRNKKFLLLSAAIYFLALFIGLIIGYFIPGLIENFLNSVVKSDKQFVMKNGISTFSIFLHNLTYGVFFPYTAGVTGIITAGILILNGFLYGSFLGFLSSNIGSILSPLGVSNPVAFLIYTIPHGIFETSGIIVAGAGGFKLTNLVINIIMDKKTKNELYNEFKDSLILVVIAIILILIAAVIEANITLPLGNYITHLSLAK